MKKIYLAAFCILLSCFAFADNYKIVNVTYDTQGLTRQYVLSQKIPVDTVTVFPDAASFEHYIANLRQELDNERIFQTTEVSLTYLDKDSNGIVPVEVLITTVDTLNIIGVPYPSYDSNTGLTLKIKIKDYNFLGSMETMDFDLNYQAKGTDNLDDVTHVYGINFGFSVPFNFICIPATWNSGFKFSYTVGNPEIDMKINEGISFSVPVADVTSLIFSLKQYYIQDSDYLDTHDDKYLEEDIGLSVPFTIANIPDWSAIVMSPSISCDYIWDFDSFKGVEFGGILDEDLRGPKIVISNSFSGGRINWFGNFRDGLSASFSQSLRYNMYKGTFAASMSISSQYHKKLCSFIGFSSNQHYYLNFSDVQVKIGSMLRGIRDNDWKSSNYLRLNFDMPFSLFHTNWGKWLGWDKLNFVNFEFQLSPFFDIAVGDNTYAESKYNLKDGWYGTGIEAIVFPDRLRSIQVRASLGIDAAQFLMKKKPQFADTLFNTDWRRSHSSGWYELSISVGLFY